MTSVFVTPFRPPPDEDVLPRAVRDMKAAARRWWFGPFVVLLGFGFGLFAFFAFDGAPHVARSVGTTGAGVGGVALAFLEVFVVIVIRTPYQQRNEAREHRDWSASSIGDPIAAHGSPTAGKRQG